MRITKILSYASHASYIMLASAAAQTNANITTLFQLETNGTWFENLIVRPNGQILATRIDVPELWTIDPSSPNTGSRLHTIPNAKSLLGIVSLSNDIYAIVAGNFSIPNVKPTKGSFGIWQVDLQDTTTTHPPAKQIVHIPEAEFLDGLIQFNNDLLLVTDATKGVIWRVDIHTGAYSTALSHPLMRPEPGQAVPVGVNGVKVHDGHVYFSSTTQEILARVPVAEHDASPTGEVEVVGGGIVVDDFWILGDGSVYVATNTGNSVLKMSPGGSVRKVAGNAFRLEVAGSTAVVAAKDADGDVLYVTTAGGLVAPVGCKMVEPAKVVAIRV